MVYLPLYLKVTPLMLALLSFYPDMRSGFPILMLPLSSLALSLSYFSPQMWLLLQHRQATAQPWEDLCPCLKPGRNENFSALAENWSFVMLKHWHQFCCDFVLHFDIALYSQFGIELEKMRIVGSWFLKLLILYQYQPFKALCGRGEGVLFNSVLLTKLRSYFINLKIK